MESGHGKLDFDCDSCKVEGPNFSLINYEDAALCDILSDVDVCDWNLWLSAAAIILQPQLRLLIDYKYKKNTWSTQLGPLAFFLGLFKLWHFLETVHEQPTWSTLQNDWGMYAGQSLLTIGAFLLLICLARFGVWDTFVRIDFRTVPPGSPQKKSIRRRQLSHVPRKYRDLAVVYRAGCFCGHLGYSVLCASKAGVLLTFLQAAANGYCLTGG